MTKMKKFRIGISTMLISSSVLAVGIPTITYFAVQPKQVNSQKSQTSLQSIINNSTNKFTIDEFKRYIDTNEDQVKEMLAEQFDTKPFKISNIRVVDKGDLTFYLKEKEGIIYKQDENITVQEFMLNNEFIYEVTIKNLKFYKEAVSKKDLRNIWKTANDFIANKKVTIADKAKEQNYEQFKNEIISTISNIDLSSGVKLKEYWDGNIERNFNNLSFQFKPNILNANNIKFSNVVLDEGYVSTDENGKVYLNNLAFSSPEEYFSFNDKKDTLMGLSDKGKNEKNILIPYGVKKINDYKVFYHNNKIEKLILPDTITELPAQGFQKMTSLKHIKLSRNLKVLPNSLFADDSIEKLEWYRGITTIEKNCFFDTVLKGDLVLPSTIKEIKQDAFKFEGLSSSSQSELNLTSITTWATKMLDQNVFSGQVKLQRINLMSENINAYFNFDFNVFSGLPLTTKIYVKTQKIKDDIIKKCILENDDEDDQFTIISEDQIVVDPNLDLILK